MSNVEKNKIQKEIVEQIGADPHGLLLLSPRIGKTKIGIDIIKKQKPKSILWITPSTKLRDKDIPEEFIQWRAKTYLNKATVVCWASLSGVTGHYDIVIMDEYQDITDNNVINFFNGKITYKNIIGLSGTHPKHEEKQNLLSRLKLKVLVNISIDEAVDKGLVAPYKITVVECRLDSKTKNVKGGSKTKPFMTTEFSQYSYMTRIINAKMFSGQTVPQFYYLNRMRFIYNNKSKNDFAKRFVKKLRGRTLIFTGSIEKAESISKYTYHSKTDDKDYNRFQAGEINELACVNSGGVGNTYRNVDNFVIVQVNSNKKGDATQKIARSLVLQEGYEANIYILSLVNTVDEKWKDRVLADFNKDRVTHVSWKNYE